MSEGKLNLILKYIENIEHEDGETLSFGSIRTLGDIKRIIKDLLNESR
jgi:hypothetical protein